MIKVIELFAGVGAQRMAFKRLGIPHEVVGISEIDKYAIKSYEAIHGETCNFGDICKIDMLPYADLWTYSFPCQDLSLAGKQAGLGEGTRSGLLFQVERLLNIANRQDELPKYLLLENVKNLVGKKFKPDFDKWLEFLSTLGYNNYWKVLNAKDYNVPQNRERVFVVSIRKDVDNHSFRFPEPCGCSIRLKDLLEQDVDGKYYLREEIQQKFREQLAENLVSNAVRVGGRGSLDRHTWDLIAEPQVGCTLYDQGATLTKFTDVSHTLLSREHKGPCNQITTGVIECQQVGQLKACGAPYNKMLDADGRVYASEGASPTVRTVTGGNKELKIFEPFVVASRGRDPKNLSDRTTGNPRLEQRFEPNFQGTSNALTSVAKDNFVCAPPPRVRKLTPRECWRLMGFSDEDFDKASAVCSKTQLYKQTGNSIVVNVLEGIFHNLFTCVAGVI